MVPLNLKKIINITLSKLELFRLQSTNTTKKYMALGLCLHCLLPDNNPLYTGGLFPCYMLVESICHFRDVGFILVLLFYFSWKMK